MRTHMHPSTRMRPRAWGGLGFLAKNIMRIQVCVVVSDTVWWLSVALSSGAARGGQDFVW